MRTSSWDDLPKASHPASSSTISVNRLEPVEFPFKRFSAFPELWFALENLIISITTLVAAVADCVLTLYVWIPIGLAKSVLRHLVDPLLRWLTSHPGRVPPQPASQVIVLSGASSGIGASLVKVYAKPDNVLILFARNPARLNQVAKLARSAGCKAVETHSIDYSFDGAQRTISQAIRAAHQKYGSIDLVLSVAGTVAFTDDNPRGPEPWGENTIQRLNKVNIFSPYSFIMTSWELMKKQKSGNICIISSSVAFHGPAQFAAYAAAKASLLTFSQSLRMLSQPYGIRVSCICPGFIESGMTGDMAAAGSTMPGFAMADSHGMAGRIKQAIDAEQAVVIWPISHVLPLLAASRLNCLNSELVRWVASKIGVTGGMVS